MNKLISIIGIFLLTFSGCSVGVATYIPQEHKNAASLQFRFKKGLWPGTYYLTINNKDPKRTVEFYGCYGADPEETNFYMVMENGTKFYFDSKVFFQIGAKGRYRVVPGRHGAIPFKIDHKTMEAASRIVFEGATYVLRMEGSCAHRDDMREITITYDVPEKRISYESGKKIYSSPITGDFFAPGGVPDLSEDSLEDSHFDNFRLTGSQDDTDPIGVILKVLPQF